MTILNPAFDHASTALAAVSTAWTADDLSVPERAFVSAEAQVVDEATEDEDCSEQLIVQVQRVFTGLPGQQVALPSANCIAPGTVEMVIRYTRCAPMISDQGEPPSAAEIQEYSEDVLARMWSARRAIAAAAREREFGECDQVLIGDAVPSGTGGAGGFELLMQVSL